MILIVHSTSGMIYSICF